MPVMRKFRRFRESDLSFNMTPMIDVTFQLLFFFILVSQLGSQTLAKLELPKPHASQAILSEGKPSMLIVNVMPAEQSQPSQKVSECVYKIEGRLFNMDQIDSVADILMVNGKGSEADKPGLEIRADRRVPFSCVRPILEAASSAGIERIDITALQESGGPS